MQKNCFFSIKRFVQLFFEFPPEIEKPPTNLLILDAGGGFLSVAASIRKKHD